MRASSVDSAARGHSHPPIWSGAGSNPLPRARGEEWFSRARGRGQAGFTLLETIIVLGVIAVLLVPVTSSLSSVFHSIPLSSGQVDNVTSEREAEYWISHDASAASLYTPGSGNVYGTFQWQDFTFPTAPTHQAEYYYDASLPGITRQETIDGVNQPAFAVARNILNQSDADFIWNSSSQQITVTLLSTIQEGPGIGDISRSATILGSLRNRPGPTTYSSFQCGPTVLVGVYQKGDAASLVAQDGNYYEVNSTPSGDMDYELCASLTSPPTINQIDVTVVANASVNNVTLNLYAKSSAGASYDATPDASLSMAYHGSTYTMVATLSPAKTALINGTKQLYVKIEALQTTEFHFYTDEVNFSAD